MITAELDHTISMRPMKELDDSDDGLNGGDACLAATVFVLWVLLTQRAERRTVDQVLVGSLVRPAIVHCSRPCCAAKPKVQNRDRGDWLPQ